MLVSHFTLIKGRAFLITQHGDWSCSENVPGKLKVRSELLKTYQIETISILWRRNDLLYSVAR